MPCLTIRQGGRANWATASGDPPPSLLALTKAKQKKTRVQVFRDDDESDNQAGPSKAARPVKSVLGAKRPREKENRQKKAGGGSDARVAPRRRLD